MSRPRRRSARAVFITPLLLCLVGVTGLLSALLGDGAWDGLSWLLLASPLLVIVACLIRAGRHG